MIPTRLHVSRRTQDTLKSLQHFVYRTITFYSSPSQKIQLCYKFVTPYIRSYNPRRIWFGLIPFRSPLLRKSIFLSFPPVTKMFQFTGLLLHTYVFSMQYLRITVSEFPHSEIPGSKFTYNSPRHIVVCHVLHQLLVPRHPPCALSNLITICYIFLI